MATEVSFTKRAAAELSRRFNGLTVRSRSQQQQQQQNASNNAAATPSKQQQQQQTAVSNSNLSNANNSNIQLTCFAAVAPEGAAVKKHHHHHQQQHHHYVRATGTRTARIAELFQGRARAVEELWLDHAFLTTLFFYVTPLERTVLAQVCRSWRDALYRQPRFWHGVLPVLHCRDMRCAKDLNATSELRKRIYQSLEQRGFPCLCLFGCNDDDVYDIVSNFPQGHVRQLRCLQLRCCNVTDKGHEVLLEFLCGVAQLTMSGCNEVTDAGLWASLTPRITHLTLSDCINVADESVAAITQLLPNLRELNLQAYHVTDAALAFFGPQHGSTLSVLRLRSCWELTNHGLLNLVHALPNLSVLSLSGCSKVTDDGVELLAENLRQLRVLDLSWCPRITDAALEYIACDLGLLEELTLDRCVHVTDIGVGYLSTMVNLRVLYLRWCTQIRDFGLQHLCSMRSLQVLSLAGCALLTSSGLSSLVQLRDLRELELTNCAGASEELFEYLHEHLPMCLVIE